MFIRIKTMSLSKNLNKYRSGEININTDESFWSLTKYSGGLHDDYSGTLVASINSINSEDKIRFKIKEKDEYEMKNKAERKEFLNRMDPLYLMKLSVKDLENEIDKYYDMTEDETYGEAVVNLLLLREEDRAIAELLNYGGYMKGVLAYEKMVYFIPKYIEYAWKSIFNEISSVGDLITIAASVSRAYADPQYLTTENTGKKLKLYGILKTKKTFYVTSEVPIKWKKLPELVKINRKKGQYFSDRFNASRRHDWRGGSDRGFHSYLGMIMIYSLIFGYELPNEKWATTSDIYSLSLGYHELFFVDYFERHFLTGED